MIQSKEDEIKIHLHVGAIYKHEMARKSRYKETRQEICLYPLSILELKAYVTRGTIFVKEVSHVLLYHQITSLKALYIVHGILAEEVVD